MSIISNTSSSLDRPMDTTRRSGVTKIIKQSIPRFILDEYPLFIEFLEAYYEWLDQEKNPIEFLQNGVKYFDVDSTTDEFLNHFKSTYLEGFPKKLEIHQENVLDQRSLLKNIREFYKIKGNEKSIELLFKIVADSDTSIEYPRDYIFKSSSGNYKDYHKIHLIKDYTNIYNGFDISSLQGLQINQYEGLVNLIGTATIENSYEITRNNREYYVLTVINPSGNFIESDFSPLQIKQNDEIYNHYSVPCVSSLNIINPGYGYSVGDFFTIGNTGQDHIEGFVYQTDFDGAITKVKIFSNPVNYNGSDVLRFPSSIGTGAAFSVSTSIISEPIENYENNKNLLSKESKLQDSYEYQQFSYTVKSKRSFEEYIDVIKTVVHPSGFVIFNSLYNNIYTIRPTEYKTRIKAYEYTALGSYADRVLSSNTGYGITAPPWNPDFPGNPNPFQRWGDVFSFWPGKTNVNPNESPNCCTGAYENGSFAPNRTFLANPDQSQYAGITYWIRFPHPAVRGMTAIRPFTPFSNIKLEDFLKMPAPIIG